MAPQLSQVIHRPDGIGKIFHALHTDAGWAVIVKHGHGGLPGVIFGQGHQRLQGAVQQLSRVPVTWRRPLLGPGLHRKHEAQRPDLAKRGQRVGPQRRTFILGQSRHRAAHIHHLGVVGGFLIQPLHLGIECRSHLVPASQPQGHEALALLDIGKDAFMTVQSIGDVGGATRVGHVQQHWQVFFGRDLAAAAHQSGQKAFAKLPLGRLVRPGAQVVQNQVQRVIVFGRQGRRCGWR